jgi:hypothetical protein
MALYDEAIIDANKLREVAESAAKQQILESITPKIRAMINSRILAEQESSDDLGGDIDDEFEDEEPEENDGELTDDAESDLDISGFEDITPAENILPVSTQKVQTGSSGSEKRQIVINNTGSINISENKKKNSLVLDDDLSEGLASIIKEGRIAKNLELKLESFQNKFAKFKLSLKNMNESVVTSKQNRKVQDIYRMLVKEAYLLRKEIVKNNGGSQRLVRKLDTTIKEMKIMSTKTKRSIFDFLFEGEDLKNKEVDGLDEADDLDDADDLDEADLVLGLSSDEKKKVADAGDEDGVESALEDILSGLNFSLDSEEDEDVEGDVEDVESDEEPADDDLEGDFDFSGEEAEEEPEIEEEGDDFGQMYGEADDLDEGEEVFEIDESAIRKELSKMKNLRESKNKKALLNKARQKRRIAEEVDPKADQFGGGEVVGDMFVDVDEDKLINALVDELGSMTQKPRPPTGSSKKESLETRKAMKEAAEYKKVAQNLRSQLVEMNLFNAKLLYANKLMQNKNLTLKQQRAIVEALDNAKTLNEAKLLYKSLSGSLAKRGQSDKLSEGATRSLGSSSRSTRSAQPVKNGVEVDRWATLAGIAGK